MRCDFCGWESPPFHDWITKDGRKVVLCQQCYEGEVDNPEHRI